MCKTKGSNNFFNGNKFYYVRDVVPYIKKCEPNLYVPISWSKGGTLNAIVRGMGIEPDYHSGSRCLYNSKTMYELARKLIVRLKNKQTKTVSKPVQKIASKTYEPTPIEVMATEAACSESVAELWHKVETLEIEIKEMRHTLSAVGETLTRAFGDRPCVVVQPKAEEKDPWEI